MNKQNIKEFEDKLVFLIGEFIASDKLSIDMICGTCISNCIDLFLFKNNMDTKLTKEFLEACFRDGYAEAKEKHKFGKENGII